MNTEDKRLELIEKVEHNLIMKYGEEICKDVTNFLITIINDYEVFSRVTDVEVTSNYEEDNDALIYAYCVSLLTAGRKASSVKAYKFELNRFKAFVNKSLLDCSTIDFRHYLGIKIGNKHKSSYVSDVRNYLNAFYIWLKREGYTSENKMERILTVKTEDIIEETLSEIEIAHIRDVVKDPFDRALFEFLIASGVRAKECTNLKISDIDFISGKVHIRNGKGGKDRFTYITPVCAKYLKTYINTRPYKVEYLFASKREKGSQMTADGIAYRVQKIKKIADIPRLHPHLLRKTMATRLVKNGMDISLVQDLLGHANLDTTKRYVIADEETIRTAYFNYA